LKIADIKVWVESVLMVDDQIVDAAELDGWTLTVGACDMAAPRILLAHVTVTEDRASGAAYRGLTILALQGDPARRTGTIDLAQPLLILAPAEQQAMRNWLVAKHWPAWARAALSVRTLLGAAEGPIALAEAARQWMLPLATLSGAALAERLPTIRVGDRHLIYRATIGEALQRGVLQPQRGRPRQRRA
jgi:hypothetical protein